MAVDLKSATPDTTLPSTGFLFGADSQAAAAPSVYPLSALAQTLLGGTSLSGDTVTASKPLLDMAQTWNNAAVTFTADKINVTDTASNAASLLFDRQVNGVSQFSINKAGVVVGGPNSGFSFGGGIFWLNSSSGFRPVIGANYHLGFSANSSGYPSTSISPLGAGSLAIGNGSPGDLSGSLSVLTVALGSSSINKQLIVDGSSGTFQINSGGYIAWGNSSNLVGATLQTKLYQDAAGTLALRNGANAQAFNVYNTYTDASNYERLGVRWSSDVAYLGPQKAGTGSDRLMVVQTGIVTVAALPSASTAGAGARAMVSDATATTFASTVSGGGANKVPVVSDGTDWLIG